MYGFGHQTKYNPQNDNQNQQSAHHLENSANRQPQLFSLDELNRFPEPPENLYEALWQGGYPRIYDQGIPAARWLADYVTTYLERDVRQVLNVGDLMAFGTFLRLTAGRTAQALTTRSMLRMPRWTS